MNTIDQKISNYKLIKDYAIASLERAEKPLKQGKIEELLIEINTIITELPPEMATKIITFSQYDYIVNLTEDEYALLEKELKGSFDVIHNRGKALTGKEQRKRDDKWWKRFKSENELYYWDRYEKFISSSLPYESVKTINVDTDEIMGYLADPKEEQFERYGMVVGHVQSGKTGNYSALVSKAADAGYKFIVVIAGGLNNLRNQTQNRLNESFIGRDGEKNIGVGNYSNTILSKRPVSLTSSLSDFKINDANKAKQGLDLDMGDRPVILVLKKHTKTLSNVIDWITSHYHEEVKDHAMLLIDDESDYASINTSNENTPTKINSKIRELLSLFRKKVYVAYTATPYANIFIDYKSEHDQLGKDLFPEDFIYSLEAPSNYFGAAKVFLDPQKRYFVNVTDHEDIFPTGHKSDLLVEDLPESLLEAIRLFMLNVSIRHLRRQEDKHNSMMIHVTRFTSVHNEIYFEVSKYLEFMQKTITIHGGNPDNPKLKDLKDTFNKYYDNKLEFTWEEVLHKTISSIKKIETREVHNNSRVPLEYDDNYPNNYIVIGGTSLARGYTLEGLSVSYFLRNTILYDTLMQMGRWFGYRNQYEDLCKVFMTEDYFNKFAIIIEATIDLVNDFDRMRKLQLTPKDFGLAVKHHPDSGLQVTARNKLKNTKDIHYDMCLDGHLKETAWLSANESTVSYNLNVVKNLISRLPLENRQHSFKNNNNIQNTVWSSIPKNVIEDFLDKFKCYNVDADEFGMYSRMPLRFIQQYVQDINTEWDIVVHTGNSTEEIIINDYSYGTYQFRNIDLKGTRFEFRNRQVSSGNSEEATLTKEDILEIREIMSEKKKQKAKVKSGELEELEKRLEEFSARKEARSRLKRPLLMLHLFKLQVQQDGQVIEGKTNIELAAFSISFPTIINSGNKNIRLKVNKVYLDNLEREIQEEGDFDDIELD
ncbi:Z1 domain-containing protein [Lysinibacillus sp. TE18511]